MEPSAINHLVIASLLSVFLLISLLSTKLYIDTQWDIRPLQPTGKDSFSFASETKVVAFWDPDAAKPDPLFGLGYDMFKKCPESRCIPLPKDGTMENADAVIFNTRKLSLLRRPETLPQRKHPGQIFVFYNMESPLRTQGLLKHPVFYDVFNLTLTYRLDSDVPMYLVKVIPLGNPTYKEEHPRNKDIRKYKSKMAVWFVSACNKSGSPRIQYAAELAKYISVDIYGKCGNLTCPIDEKGACMKMAEKTYKFYLAFENSACVDYVTEKLKHPLSNNMIPIVMGGVNYDVRAPPHSVINVLDYKSPKDLAEYLILLDEKQKLYEEYFVWKKTHQVVNWRNPYCRLCSILHNSTYPYKSGFNASEWWYSNTCVPGDKFTKQVGLSTGGD